MPTCVVDQATTCVVVHATTCGVVHATAFATNVAYMPPVVFSYVPVSAVFLISYSFSAIVT